MLSQTKRKRDALSKWILFKEEIFHERKTYRKRFISIYDRRAVSRMRRRKYFSDFGGGTSDTGSATTESTAETEAANNENSGEKITIRLTNWGTTEEGAAEQQLIDEFNETNDMNIEIVFDLVPSEGYGDRLTTSFSSGDGYDIFTSGEGDFFKWVDRGVAMSMDEVIAADTDFTQTLPDSLMNMGKINGQQYYMVIDDNPINLYYGADQQYAGA